MTLQDKNRMRLRKDIEKALANSTRKETSDRGDRKRDGVRENANRDGRESDGEEVNMILL